MAKQKASKALSEAKRRIEHAAAVSALDLDLMSLGLAELPDSISQLKQLQRLNLSGNDLSSVPESLGQLKQLRELNLSGNQISSVPESIGQLKQLQELDLHSNPLSSLPRSLGQLEQLQVLCLYDTQLSSVPGSIGQLKQLRWLYLFGNEISSVPESLGQLKQLQELDLSGNQISSVPGSLGQLTALELLDLSDNQLTFLPASLNKLSQLKKLFLHNNKGLGIPPEVLGPNEADVLRGSTPADPSAILRYYFQVRAGKRPLNEVKFILMGRGGVGKTSLVNRLVRNEFIPDLSKTEGIQITQWPVTVGAETVRLHIWDFGGQEMMHATHQFFLTERSLYLVVLSGREGAEDEDAEYWLKLASSFGSGSPVIVVLNKMNEHRFDVNRRALLQKYPSIQTFVASDCKSGLGIADLKNALCTTLSAWKEWRVAFPAAWFKIKERLAGMTESYLSFEQFQEVCRNLGERDTGAHAALAGYLHDLGIALNYKDDPRLRETHVLNPHWVTGGIYRILNAKVLASTKGVLHYADLSDILPTDSYPRAMQMFLLDLMRKFELCFPFADEPDRYLVPELLDKQQHEEAERFSPVACLGVRVPLSDLTGRVAAAVHRAEPCHERRTSAVAAPASSSSSRAAAPWSRPMCRTSECKCSLTDPSGVAAEFSP